jgi:hypothetical protein
MKTKSIYILALLLFLSACDAEIEENDDVSNEETKQVVEATI